MLKTEFQIDKKVAVFFSSLNSIRAETKCVQYTVSHAINIQWFLVCAQQWIPVCYLLKNAILVANYSFIGTWNMQYKLPIQCLFPACYS